LGGDSLRAFQILARVRDEFNIELTAQEFFEAPTIVAQAALVRTKPIRRASPISRRPR
jgi:acyl carrier protein